MSSFPEPPQDRGRFGAPYWRFTVLFAVMTLVIALVPLLESFSSKPTVTVTAGLAGLAALAWVVIAGNAIVNGFKLRSVPALPLQSLHAARERKFQHIVIVPCYLDPLPLLVECLESLMLQDNPDSLLVVVTFEARAPEVDAKAARVQAQFGQAFGTLLIVRHVLEPRTEIPGGCSNKNFAIRAAYDHIRADPANAQYAYTVSTCDTDSLFHPTYFATLEACYNAENPSLTQPPKPCVWQAPTLYNWNLDQRPFFVRITGLLRTMMMMGGLIALSLNPMSIFSYPLPMAVQAGFINPRYSVDDIIARVRWLTATKSAVPVKLLPVYVVSGPTNGVSFSDEVLEWARQIRRWIIGASESFHYFLIHFRGRPLAPGLVWFATFYLYYAYLLCAAAVVQLLAAVPWPWAHGSLSACVVGASPRCLTLSQVLLVTMAVQYAAFGVAFVLDAVAVRRMNIKESVHPLRNLLHWLVTPAVMTVYSLIALVSIVRFCFVGKKLAGHDMAGKDGLERDAEAGDVAPPAAAAAAATASTDDAMTEPLLAQDHSGVKSPALLAMMAAVPEPVRARSRHAAAAAAAAAPPPPPPQTSAARRRRSSGSGSGSQRRTRKASRSSAGRTATAVAGTATPAARMPLRLTESSRVVVLGAGPCGLGAAYRAAELGHKHVVVFERNAQVGGLSTTYTNAAGFRWDLGGHVYFSRSDYFQKLFSTHVPTYQTNDRVCYVRMFDRWIAYPLQLNIGFLPDDVAQKCLSDIEAAHEEAAAAAAGAQPGSTPSSKARTMQQFAEATFGRELTRVFMQPYNYKVWAHPLHLMSDGWIADRVALVPLEQARASVQDKVEHKSWGPNSQFKYAHHGAQELFVNLAATLPAGVVRTSTTVTQVDLAQRVVTLHDGTSHAYDALLNTMPLDVLVRDVIVPSQVPLQVRDAAAKLRHSGAFIVGIGLEGKVPQPWSWMYFPEPDVPFYRVTYLSNYSPMMTPDKDRFYSVLAEVSFSPFKVESESDIVERVLTGLRSAGVIGADDAVVSTWNMKLDYAYPTPSLERDQALQVILPWLESHGVRSRGRFGLWRYEIANTDHVTLQGIEAIDNWFSGKEETTITGKS